MSFFIKHNYKKTFKRFNMMHPRIKMLVEIKKFKGQDI